MLYEGGVLLQHLACVRKGVVHQRGIRPGLGQAEAATLADPRTGGGGEEVARPALGKVLLGDAIAVVGGPHDLQACLGGLTASGADENAVGLALSPSHTPAQLV